MPTAPASTPDPNCQTCFVVVVNGDGTCNIFLDTDGVVPAVPRPSLEMIYQACTTVASNLDRVLLANLLSDRARPPMSPAEQVGAALMSRAFKEQDLSPAVAPPEEGGIDEAYIARVISALNSTPDGINPKDPH